MFNCILGGALPSVDGVNPELIINGTSPLVAFENYDYKSISL